MKESTISTIQKSELMNGKLLNGKMSQIYFISDPHIGHKSILRHSKGLRGDHSTVTEHDKWVYSKLMSIKPTKRTIWYFLGDVCMNIDRLILYKYIPGRKRLILGNHDLFNTRVYQKYFEIFPACRKYNMWLSHIPIHPTALFNSPNIHGHCHHDELKDDPRYLNTAIEWLPFNKPISLEEVREYFG